VGAAVNFHDDAGPGAITLEARHVAKSTNSREQPVPESGIDGEKRAAFEVDGHRVHIRWMTRLVIALGC